jgi:type I restriction enzyme, S subunit
MIRPQKNEISLPSSWRLQPLSAFNAAHPSTIDPADYPDEMFEYYSIPAYQDGQRPTLSKGNNIGSTKLLLESGTVLFGKLNPRVEKVWRVGNHSSHRKIGSMEWLPLVSPEGIDGEFVYFLMWSEHVMPEAKRFVSGSTPSRQRVNPSSFYRIQAPLPPLGEQRKIALVLRLVQQAIEQLERLLVLTSELKKALFLRLFTQGLHQETQKQTDLGAVPESWELRPLEQAGEVVYGIQAAVARNVKPVGTKILTNKNITLDGRITLEAINYFVLKTPRHHETVLRKGDLLFNWRSGSKEHVGKTAYLISMENIRIHRSFSASDHVTKLLGAICFTT